MMLRSFLVAVFVCLLSVSVGAQTPVPRTVIALVEGGPDFRLRETRSHVLATMPLEQLGLIVEYHRADRPLPDLSARSDVRGVFAWLTFPARPKALELLSWYERALDLGKKLVVFGDIGVFEDTETGALPVDRVNRLFERIGLNISGNYIAYTDGATYRTLNRKVWGFEYTPPLPPPFQEFTRVDPTAISHLTVEIAGTRPARSDLIVTGPHGGFVAPSYAAQIDPPSNIRRWLVNPFEFFRLAFATDDLPKPDTTTLVGRRIYYSHVDGDGWRSVSEVKLDDKPASAAKVLLERVVKEFPELPVTIAPIAAELDPAWIDDADARRVAHDFFSQPQVEGGSHTYSHPFKWSYFEHYDAESERAIVHRADRNQDIHQGYADLAESERVDGEPDQDIGRYTLPRAFFSEPFDLNREIAGSVERIAEVGGKPVRVLQWSGDTSPFEAALAATRKAGIPNINGGDTRFDSDFRSYGFVAPMGMPVGSERQIYASMSNENTYTDLWTGRFFAYRHVLQTIERTELPIRVKPINLYYHSYSAEKIASTNALITVHEAMRGQDIAPVATSRFARIAEGFYTARFVPIGDRSWRIEGRGALQTLRFDHASLTAVDFARSSGVLGARPLHGSLYVALDPAVEGPVLALTDRAHPMDPDPSPHPYLLESRWPVEGVTADPTTLTATAQGFGPLSMTWVMPQTGRWRVRIDQEKETVLDRTVEIGDERHLLLAADDKVVATLPARIRIDRIGN